MNVELSWESQKKSIQNYMEKKVSSLGEDFSFATLDNDKNLLDRTEAGEFERFDGSRFWIGPVIGFIIFLSIIISAGIGLFPVQLAYSEGWWSTTVYNWQNIGIFVIGIPLIFSVVFGFLGSKSDVWQKASLDDAKRWDLYDESKEENVLTVFYNNSDSIEVKSFKDDLDNLAATIASDLSNVIGSDKLTLTVCGTKLLTLDGKKFCQYCGLANPESNSKCEKCGANLGGL